MTLVLRTSRDVLLLVLLEERHFWSIFGAPRNQIQKSEKHGSLLSKSAIKREQFVIRSMDVL